MLAFIEFVKATVMNRERDKSFLDIAWLAGGGGVLAIGFSIGMPLVRAAHHQPWSPAFFFFSLWGLAALCGCAACIYTYYTSGPPPKKPPRGGLPATELTVIDGGRQATSRDGESQRAA